LEKPISSQDSISVWGLDGESKSRDAVRVLPRDFHQGVQAFLGLAVADVESPRASTGQGPREEVPDDNGVSIPPIAKSVEQVEGKTIVGVKTYDGHTFILSICDHVTVAVEDFPRNLTGV
jgi:hypothetical protein